VDTTGKINVCYLSYLSYPNDLRQSEEVMATAGKINVGYPNDLLKSGELTDTAGKRIVGNLNNMLKSERHLNNLLCLKSEEVMDTTVKTNVGALTDMLCRKSEEVTAGDAGGVDKELVRIRHVKHGAAVHAGHQRPVHLHQGPATAYSPSSSSQQQQQRSAAVHAQLPTAGDDGGVEEELVRIRHVKHCNFHVSLRIRLHHHSSSSSAAPLYMLNYLSAVIKILTTRVEHLHQSLCPLFSARQNTHSPVLVGYADGVDTD